MGAYILRRLLLMIPTLFGIMLVSFVVVQFAPGGPVEQVIAQMSGHGRLRDRARHRHRRGRFRRAWTRCGPDVDAEPTSQYRGARGLRPEYIAALEKQFGFDKPPLERFFMMLWNYLRFDFGNSYFRGNSVIDLVLEKMPVSITLGLWMTLPRYGISIPLGIAKAVRDGSRFDVWTSGVIIVGYALPGFLFAILLIVLFAGGSFWNIFPLARPHLGELGPTALVAADPRLSLAHHAADHRHGARRLRDDDAPHQELVPRRDPQAIRRHRARQGAERAAACSTATSSATRCCCVIAELPRRLHRRLLRRLAPHRDHLLARWPRPARLQGGARPRLSGDLRDALRLLAASASSSG